MCVHFITRPDIAPSASADSEKQFRLQVTFISRHREDNIVVVVGIQTKELYGREREREEDMKRPHEGSAKKPAMDPRLYCITTSRGMSSLIGRQN
jgi:hypothetical protein